jgi:regulator of sigma E protease
MNLLLAVVLTAAVLYQGAEVPIYQDQPPVVGFVQPGSPAAQVGIAPGDLITSVAGRGVDTWEDLLIAIGTRPNREVEIGVRRDGVEATRLITPTADPEGQFEIGDIGVFPNAHPRVPVVNPGEPAEKAGIRPGDVVLAVNGREVTFGTQLREAIAQNAEKPVTLTVRRGEERLDITATPASCAGKPGCPPAGIWLGIQIGEETKSIQPGAFEAVTMSVERNVEMAGLIMKTIWDLLRRETSPKQLMGPVAIAQLSGQSAEIGWVALFGLMASISLNLGLLNLLPIPVLDGGHIAIMALEGVARRDFSMRVKEKMLLAGFVVLMMLMVTVIYNDLTRISWIERLMPWR